jgi:hypothetical protein
VTVDESDHYQDLTGQGEHLSGLTDAASDAEVLREGPGGVDPIPWIRQMRIPRPLDLRRAARLSARRLEPIAAEPGRDLTVLTFPHANHALVETPTGLTSEMLRSDVFEPGMFAAVGAWLRARGLGAR